MTKSKKLAGKAKTKATATLMETEYPGWEGRKFGRGRTFTTLLYPLEVSFV